MSLLRLLTAGKSLVGLKKSESRYHLPGEKSLPRFGSKKNPFRATVFPEKGEQAAAEEGVSGQPCASPPDATPGKSGNEVEESPATSDLEPGHKEFACSVPDHGKGEAPAKPAFSSPARPRTGFKAFLLWRRVRPKSLASFSGRPLVQGELSLDAVKVMRNDLSESDLEVVQRRTAQGSKGAKNSDAGAVSKRPVSEPEYFPAEGMLGASKM